MKKSLFALFFTIFFSISCYSQINVLSPAEGNWANKQMLVIDNSDGGDYFYSLDGNDPEKFGFAYDGPVLIDLTGDITIKIKKNGKKKAETTVKYSVNLDNANSKEYFQFISSFYDTGIINYTSGSEIFIPDELFYKAGIGGTSYIKGQMLSISENNVLSRCIPIEILDKTDNKKWRFILKTYPRNAGVYSKKDVPFEIKDWNYITFVNQNYIYRIDDEYWSLPKEPVKIDRSVNHTIYWQNLEYAQGNPVESFELPAKPKIKKNKEADGSINYIIDGDYSYLMSLYNPVAKEYQELFSIIGADTVFGDNISGKLQIGLFSNSVYQGTIDLDYDVIKRPPADPDISTTCKEFYSRRPVSAVINCEKGADLYVSVTGPYIIKDLAESYSRNSMIFDYIETKEFEKVNTSNYKINLIPNEEGASYFKIQAYTQKNDIKSPVCEYTVLIDQYNYYYDEASNAANPDGTPDRPYTNFKECMESINNGRYALVRIRGTVTIPNGETEIFSNCTLLNTGDAEFLFAKDSSLIINGSTIAMENFNLLMQNEDFDNSDKLKSIFKLKNSVLDLKNCQVSVNYGKKANFIEGYNSSVNLSDCVISVNASNYASCVSGTKIRVKAVNSIMYSTADTSVIFSLSDSTVNLVKNSFKVSGKMGRIGEFFNVKGTINQNVFKSQIPTENKKETAKPLYIDQKCKIEEKDNNSNEF